MNTMAVIERWPLWGGGCFETVRLYVNIIQCLLLPVGSLGHLDVILHTLYMCTYATSVTSQVVFVHLVLNHRVVSINP